MFGAGGGVGPARGRPPSQDAGLRLRQPPPFGLFAAMVVAAEWGVIFITTHVDAIRRLCPRRNHRAQRTETRAELVYLVAFGPVNSDGQPAAGIIAATKRARRRTLRVPTRLGGRSSG